MSKIDSSYRLPIIFSLVLHALLLFFLIAVPLSHDMPTFGQQNKPQDIIQAVSVDPRVVAKEVAAIKQQQTVQQRQQEQAKLAQMRAEQQKLQQKIAEQQAIALKQQQEAQKKKQEAERQAKLKAKQEQEEKIKQQQLAEKKRQEEAKRKAEEQKKKQLAEQLKQQQQAMIQQQIAAEQQALQSAQAKAQQQKMLSEINKYKALILQTVAQNWLVPANVDKSLSCQLLITLGPGGAVINVQVSRSSGNVALDNSAKTAVYSSSPLPVPSDPALFDKFRKLELTVRPEKII